MEGSWNLYEVWSYDEFLEVFAIRNKAIKYIEELIFDQVYERQDLYIRERVG